MCLEFSSYSVVLCKKDFAWNEPNFCPLITEQWKSETSKVICFNIFLKFKGSKLEHTSEELNDWDLSYTK
jgi:hypothetical protein